MARTPDLKLHALWRARVRRHAESGLTIAQFCARESLSVASFHGWKRRLRHIDLGDHLPALSAPSAFLPVTLSVVERAANEAMPIEADLSNGIHLRIPTTNTSLACRLVRALAEAKTRSGGWR
jgi:hypothetical protein